MFLFSLCAKAGYIDETFQESPSSVGASGLWTSWQYTLNGLDPKFIPVWLSNTNTFGFGVNASNPVAVTNTYILKKNLGETFIPETRIKLYYSLWTNDSKGVATAFVVSLRSANTSSSDMIAIYHSYLGNNKTGVVSPYPGAKNCTWDQTFRNNATYKLIFDTTYQLYSVWENDAVICNAYETGAIPANTINGIYIYLQRDPSEAVRSIIRNLNITSTDENFYDYEPISCAYPDAFCDNFEYGDGLYYHDWLPQDSDLSVRTDYSPTDGKACFNAEYMSIYHSIQPFSYVFQTGPTDFTTSTQFSPVFGQQLAYSHTIYEPPGKTTLYNCTSVRAYDYVTNMLFGYYACPNGSMFYMTDNSDTEILSYCGTLSINESNTIKTLAYFKQRNYFPFNSSVRADRIEFYANGAVLCNTSFIDKASANLNKVYIDSRLGCIDDYSVFIGDDPEIDTLDKYFTQKYTEPEAQPIPQLPGSFGEEILSMYETFGLRDALSRYIAGGLILLMILGLYFMLAFATRFNIDPVIVFGVLFISSALLTYIRLMSGWLILFFFLLFMVVAFFEMKKYSSSGGG